MKSNAQHHANELRSKSDKKLKSVHNNNYPKIEFRPDQLNVTGQNGTDQ